MNNPIDPEEIRLRDAVVNAALAWEGGPQGLEASADVLDEATEELRIHQRQRIAHAEYMTRREQSFRDYRAKASAAVVPELLPCPFCRGQCDPAGWMGGGEPPYQQGPACDSCGASAQTIEIWNTRHSPAHPDIRVEPTLSEVRKIWHDHFGARCSHPNADADIMGFARTLLSQHSNHISDDILLTLRDYALTRAGKDLYLTDARRLVANSNVRVPNPSEQGG